MKRGEPPLDAARREMEEELGLGARAWRAAGELRGSDNFRHDVIHCFRAELPEPTVRADPVELATTSGSHLTRCPLTSATTCGRCSIGALRGHRRDLSRPAAYSHSIVPGGLLVMSSTTRPTGRISLIIREAICSSRS